ncbi:hypothetical protein MKW92_016903 [Papaver armeniacum]|nr:hypothetical protein MKW92_016903 [Papaver armeniacum]
MFSKLYVCEFEDWEGAEMQIDYEERENEAIMDVKVLGNRYKLSDTSYRVLYPFALQPMPTILPPPVSVSNVE